MTKSFEPENVSLQNHKEIAEERIQQKIAENPSILSPFGSVQKITRTKLIFVMLLGLFACSSATEFLKQIMKEAQNITCAALCKA